MNDIEKGRDEPAVIVCMRWGSHHVAASTCGTCAKCGCAVALAPSSIELMRENPAVAPNCWDCAMTADPDAVAPEAHPFNEAQRRELGSAGITPRRARDLVGIFHALRRSRR